MPLPAPPPQTSFTFCIEDNITGHLQLLVFFIPFIIGLLFFVTTHYRVNDISTIMLSFGFIVNNLINSSLRHMIRAPRPLPSGVCGTGFGMPAREPQQLFFFIALDIVFSRTWAGRVGYSRSCVLAFAAIASSIIYVHLEYYTAGQVAVGALIGGVVGGSFVNAVRFLLTPYMPRYVFWWNSKCETLWYMPQSFKLTHTFHWHPDRACHDAQCNSRHTGKCHITQAFSHPGASASLEDFGADALKHILIKLLIYALIHQHT